jgi:hypothetical protein
VFERFTERARQVVVLAQDEARALKHNYIGTEHLLLGLLREAAGLAARVLESLEISLGGVRARVAQIIGQGEEVTTGQIPFTPRGKKVLELSLREALTLGHNYIGTEHLLLGLARENQGVAARILHDFGADAEVIRNEVIGVLSGVEPVTGPYVPQSPPLALEFLQEMERVRTEREAAIEAQDMERAAALRERERKLRHAAKRLERAWAGEPEPPVVSVWESMRPPPPVRVRPRRMPRRVADYAPGSVLRPLLLGWCMFGVAAGIGLLVGWLIWG